MIDTNVIIYSKVHYVNLFFQPASVNNDANHIHGKVNDNIRGAATNTNCVPNYNIPSMNSTTSTLPPALALRRRGRPPKDGMPISNAV